MADYADHADHVDDADASDDFQAEMSDVGRAGAVSWAGARSPFASQQTAAQRIARWAMVLVAGLLALVIVGTAGSVTRLWRPVLTLGVGATPTPGLAPGEDLFYLLPTPPGVEVSLDGHALEHLPLPGARSPLRLGPGHHVLSWHSRAFPFLPMQCSVSVPRAAGDTCPLVASVAPDFASQPGAIIDAHDSLLALTPGEAIRLTQAIQHAFDASRSMALIQPGERYFSYQLEPSGGPVVAQQPLRATVSYQFLANAGYPEPCLTPEPAIPAIPCRFPGQDCSQLCTVLAAPPSTAGSPHPWVAAALVSAAWDYRTLDGRVVAQHVEESFGVQLAALGITWDGAEWRVTPTFGHTPGLPVADDAVCDQGRFGLEQTPWSFMLADPPLGAQIQFISDATPTDGCLIVLNPHPSSGPPALFLQRFGVLLAVNAPANRTGVTLPLADSAERNLAYELAAQAHLSV